MGENIIVKNSLDFDQYENLVLIDGKISNYNYFFNNCSSNTLPIVFNYGSNSNTYILNKEAIEIINNKYKEIEVYHKIKEKSNKKQKKINIDYLKDVKINKLKKLCIV